MAIPLRDLTTPQKQTRLSLPRLLDGATEAMVEVQSICAFGSRTASLIAQADEQHDYDLRIARLTMHEGAVRARLNRCGCDERFDRAERRIAHAQRADQVKDTLFGRVLDAFASIQRLARGLAQAFERRLRREVR